MKNEKIDGFWINPDMPSNVKKMSIHDMSIINPSHLMKWFSVPYIITEKHIKTPKLERQLIIEKRIAIKRQLIITKKRVQKNGGNIALTQEIIQLALQLDGLDKLEKELELELPIMVTHFIVMCLDGETKEGATKKGTYYKLEDALARCNEIYKKILDEFDKKNKEEKQAKQAEKELDEIIGIITIILIIIGFIVIRISNNN